MFRIPGSPRWNYRDRALLLNKVPEPRSSEVFKNSCLVFCSGTGPSKGWQHQAGELQSRCVRVEANAEQNDFVLAACLTLTLLCMTQLQYQSSFRHTELPSPKGALMEDCRYNGKLFFSTIISQTAPFWQSWKGLKWVGEISRGSRSLSGQQQLLH